MKGMNFSKSISWRIAIWHSILFMSILSLFSGLLYLTFSDSLTKEVDSMLAREGGMIAYCIENGYASAEIKEHMNRLPVSAGVQKEELYWQIENAQGNVIAASQNLHGQRINDSDALQKIDEHTYVWDPELNGVPLRAMSIRLQSKKQFTGEITVATYDRIRHFAIDQLWNIMIICNVGFAGISIAAGWLISRKTLLPIHKIIAATQKITATNLHDRLPIEGPKDELQILAVTLNGMIDRLEVSFAQIQQFASDVSHELRTSLTILRGELDVALTRNRSAEEYKRVLHSVLEEVIYLSDMVEKFLYLSRKTSSRSNQIELKMIDFERLFQSVRNHLSSSMMKKQIELHVQMPRSINLLGDEDLLRRLFINLMENAIKYTPEDGTVGIKVERNERFIQIEVADNGIGIPEEHLPFIFQRFYRVDDSRTRSQGGTGLGLALCKWTVEVHKGTIEVRSAPDRGTTVIVNLLAG